MIPETDAKKIKDGMMFNIGKEFYLKAGKNAIRLDTKPFETIIFEDFIREHENEIKYIFKSNGKTLYKKRRARKRKLMKVRKMKWNLYLNSVWSIVTKK